MPKNSPEQMIDRPHDAGLRRGGTGTASSGSGATTFTALTDVPHSYAGEAGAVLVANALATGLEFGAVATATPTASAIPIAAATGLIANGWLDATLASLATLGTVADRIAYTTALDVWAEATLTSFARTILDDANQAAVQATLALVPGTNVQAFDATLLSIAALGTAADKMLYTTAIDTWAEAAITAFGRSQMDDADAAAGRGTLGLGTIATEAEANYALLAGRASGQTLNGDTAANGDIIINGTAHATKTTSYVLIQKDGGNTAIGAAITAPSGVLHAGATAFADTVLFERTGQTTDTFVASMRLLVTKTTNMVDGFGPGFALAIQDDAGVVSYIGVIGAVRAGADNTGDIVIAPVVAGVTTATVRARATGGIDVLQPTLGDAVLKLASTATNDDPAELTYQNRVATTDATVTTLHTFTLAQNTTYNLDVQVTARRTAGTGVGAANDGAGVRMNGTYKGMTGTATIIGALTVVASHLDTSMAAVTMTVSGATVLVRVTGTASNSIVWHLTARVNAVSS